MYTDPRVIGLRNAGAIHDQHVVPLIAKGVDNRGADAITQGAGIPASGHRVRQHGRCALLSYESGHEALAGAAQRT